MTISIIGWAAPVAAIDGPTVVGWVGRICLLILAGFGIFGVAAWLRSIILWRRAGQPLRPQVYLVPIVAFMLLAVASLVAIFVLPPDRGLAALTMFSGFMVVALAPAHVRPQVGVAPHWTAGRPFRVVIELLSGIIMFVLGLGAYLSL